MNLLLQIPITDLRFAMSQKQKLSNPSWPLPKLNRKPFIRKFGHVQKREMGGIDEWAGEEYFCNASRAIQYTDLHLQKFKTPSGKTVRVQKTFKRFFSDGGFMNKIELGLRDDSASLILAEDEKINLTSLLKHYMSLPVQVNGKKLKLFKCGSQIATTFCESTTRHNKVKADQKDLVQDGEICVLAILPGISNITLPREAKPINKFNIPGTNETIELYGYTLHLEGYYIKSWLIVVPERGLARDEAAYALLRNLRINLMRIHAEKETIKGILQAVMSKTIDIENKDTNSKLITDYLKTVSETLFKTNRYNLQQGNMLDFALHSEDISAPGDLSSLEKQVNNKFTLKNIQKFIEKTAPVSKKLILFICSSPSEKNPLNFGIEFKTIKDLHQKSVDRANYDIEIETSVRRTDLAEKLASYKPDILHVSLHGSATNGLYFEQADGSPSPMTAKEWADILRVQKAIHKPRIVILSACNSFNHAEQSKAFCDFVIGTSMVIPDAAGVVYAKGFYAILFNDENTDPDVCHEAGLNALKYYTPPFDPIKEMQIYDIIKLY